MGILHPRVQGFIRTARQGVHEGRVGDREIPVHSRPLWRPFFNVARSAQALQLHTVGLRASCGLTGQPDARV